MWSFKIQYKLHTIKTFFHVAIYSAAIFTFAFNVVLQTESNSNKIES